MELKKNPKADLKKYRGLLLEIGLILSLILVIAAFTYTPKEVRIEKVEMEYAPVEEQITEITRQDLKVPPPPKKVEVKVITDLLQVVTNDTKVEMDVDFTEFDEDVEVVASSVGTRQEVIEDDQPFLFAETMPSFNGGDLGTFRKWVMERIQYPQIAAENGISGRVIVTFVIEKDGSLTNIEVLLTPDRSLSDEASRILKMSPKWTPAMQRNQPVRLKFTLPVEFSIQ
ncbi:MAG: TonB family protein [Rikenellaceae bacterium]